MWNLIKNVFRSLSKNKVAIVGLTFLVFLSTGIFTVLNSTSSNIQSTYNRVTTSGKLHDFTVSENYSIGKVSYAFCNGHDEGWDPVLGEDKRCTGDSSDHVEIPWPEQTSSSGKYARTYRLKLNINILPEEDTLRKFWNNNKGSLDYQYVLWPTITISGSTHGLNYMDGSYTSAKTANEIAAELLSSGDSAILASQENVLANTLLSMVSGQDTPFQNYLRTPALRDQVEYRTFRSLDINNSPDNIMYKVVQSNPEDVVDKVVTFDTSAVEKQHIANNNFSNTAFNPLSSIDRFSGLTVLDVLNNHLSRDIASASDADIQKIEAKFYLMSVGKYGIGSDELSDLVTKLANLTYADDKTKYETLYQQYFDDYYSKEIFYNKKYRYTLQWQTAAPTTWYLEDWSSKFAVVNPEYLKANHLQPMDKKVFIDDPAYQSWLLAHQNILTDNARFIAWMNSLKEEQQTDWFDKTKSKFPNYTINLANGGTPFLILASGITADFAYPILDLEHTTPNTKNQCIIFANTNGYERVYDGFRSNPTEDYLVGKFKNDNGHAALMNAMNVEASALMNWPKDIKAVHYANDTNNVLNASAFRIAFIPQLIEKISIIDYALTIFIIVLSLLICSIIIRRYINNSRVQIGVMQANGIKKRQIAFSLTPFAFIPAIIGGIGGYILGTLLQQPALGLFSNYWMLPTPFASFSWVAFVIAIFVPFLIFMAVSIIATFVLLREKTVDLMKSGSEYKSNIIARNIKRPLGYLGIMTRFRISVAFNSIGKLLILCVMTALSMSSLVFGMAVYHKFDVSKDATFGSRNYSYAVDLYTPTVQGGQYVPVDSRGLGESGFLSTAEGKNFVPNIYYDNGGIPFISNNNEFSEFDSSYSDVFGNDAKYFINKTYYQLTYDLYDLSLSKDDHLQQQFKNVIDGNTVVHGTTFVPTLSDIIGEKGDIQFLKNRTMNKSALNHVVGMQLLHLQSNPWDIVESLMPENNKNLCDNRSQDLIQQAGEKACWLPSDERPELNPYNFDKNGLPIKNDWQPSSQTPLFAELFIKTPNQSSDGCPYTFTFNNDKAVYSMAPTQLFMKFLLALYSDDFADKANPEQPDAKDNDYTINYNKIELKPQDETYTYLATDNNQRILGLKANTKYVNLRDGNNKNIIDKIAVNLDDPNYHPLVVNAFAAKKHNLHVGDHVNFNITNTADRIQQEINNNGKTTPKKVDFTVTGICTTYEGEEYFTNQDLANQILGLKSHYHGSQNLHDWYNDSKTTLGSLGIDDLVVSDGHDLSKGGTWDTDGDTDDLGYLHDLSNGKIIKSGYDQNNGNITPYGFNGVFTDQKDGSAILSKGFNIYSPSGIYAPNDLFNAEAVKQVLEYGGNLQLANVIAGLYNPLTKQGTELGKQINDHFDAWVAAGKTGSSDTILQNLHDALILDVDKFVQAVSKYYGNTIYTSLVTGAFDKMSTQLVFTNLSNTIDQIEITVLVIISMMVVIIVVLITIMLIGDSKRLAAILKSLGYTDSENVASFLAVYIPIIIFGLAIAIPLTFGIVGAFQLAIFNGVGILLTTTIRWWYFLIGLGVVALILFISGMAGYRQLKKDRLIDMIK